MAGTIKEGWQFAAPFLLAVDGTNQIVHERRLSWYWMLLFCGHHLAPRIFENEHTQEDSGTMVLPCKTRSTERLRKCGADDPGDQDGDHGK